MKYNQILLQLIEWEKEGRTYLCPDEDKEILHELFKEINACVGTNIQYLAEVDEFNIRGSGEIIARYITKFSSESVKSYFIPQLVSDKIKDCDKLLLQLYLHFKLSHEYTSNPGFSAPAHICVRYDNAFKALKPKRLKSDLVRLAYYPRDAVYLPLTMRMLASWKIPELEELFIYYLSEFNVNLQGVGISKKVDDFFPLTTYMKRELKFCAISGLKYYPSDKAIDLIRQYTTHSDIDIRAAAKKTLEKLLKSI